MVSAELIPESEDAVGAGFGGVKVVFGVFEGSEVFDREVFRKAFNRETGKIVGHSIESWGFVCRVLIQVRDGAD